MAGEQLDLFAARGAAVERPAGTDPSRQGMEPARLDDDALIAAIDAAGLAEFPSLAAEAGRRRLRAAVPALERICRRFAGFGVDQVVPEQVAALEALAATGGTDAARAVALLITRAVVQGPTLRVAVAAAAGLGSELPVPAVLDLLRHAAPDVRADACRCGRPSPDLVPVLIDLLDDLHASVGAAAAFALARMGRLEAKPRLLGLLRTAPSPEVIKAIVDIADEECIVLLGRIARTMPDLAAAARAALEDIDHPQVARMIAAIERQQGS